MKLARLCAVAGVVALLVSCAPPPVPSDDPDLPKEELTRLSGTWQSTWQVVSCKLAGVEIISPTDPPKILMLAPDGTFKWTKGLSAKGRVVRIDPSKQPKEIDSVLGEGYGSYEGKTSKWIYKLEGDTLTCCGSLPPSQARPTEFNSTKQNGWELTVYKRIEKIDR